jgi:hypothetical protein
MTKQFGTTGPRSIYPDIARSRSLRRCGLLANVLFPRLIPQADDQGRGQGDPADVATLTGVLLLAGVDLAAAEAAVDELVDHGMLRLYDVDGEPYWQLVGWWEWQGPAMRRAFASRHPAPPDWTDLVYGNGDGQPPTWRAALGLPPGRPGPSRTEPREPSAEQIREPVPRTVARNSGTVRTSQAKPSPARPGPAEAGPGRASRADAREAQPPDADAPSASAPEDEDVVHEPTSTPWWPSGDNRAPKPTTMDEAEANMKVVRIHVSPGDGRRRRAEALLLELRPPAAETHATNGTSAQVGRRDDGTIWCRDYSAHQTDHRDVSTDPTCTRCAPARTPEHVL